MREPAVYIMASRRNGTLYTGEKFYEYGRLRKERVDTKLSAEDMHRASRVLGLERLESFMEYVGLRKDSIAN